MVTLTETILENPAQYGFMQTGNIANFQLPPAIKEGPSLSTLSGDVIPCQRRNGLWYNFVLPTETFHLLLDMSAPSVLDKKVMELTLFVGPQEWTLPIPALRQNGGNRMMQLHLPPMPHWVQGLLCIRLDPVERHYMVQEAA